jgi:hypothetical protein
MTTDQELRLIYDLTAKIKALEAQLYSNAKLFLEDIKATEAQRDEALAEVERLKDSEFDNIMAMSDGQIDALIRLEGHDPKDVAALARKTLDLAVASVKSKQDEALLRECLPHITYAADLSNHAGELALRIAERLGETE